MDPYDPGNFRSNGPSPLHPPPRHRPGARFLKGPIPWDWLDRAGRLPGKALAVGLVLWHRAGMAGERTVRLNHSRAAGLGLGEHSSRRGLQELERAGLVSVHRELGRALEVTIRDPGADCPPVAPAPE